MIHHRLFSHRSAERQVARIDVTNLIDIIMILLIFSIISASFVKESGVTVDRPESGQATAVTGAFVPLALLKSGGIVLGGRTMPLAAVPGEVQRALREAGATRVVVQADREAPVGLLLNVMDASRRGGAKQVDVAAQRAANR
jgi:biopolymer transport protein ExbD